jgi:hypothetical protein
MSKKIISFSLWGEDRKYTVGAIKNANIAEELFPDWICRYYVGLSTPQDVVDELKSKKNVEIIMMDEDGGWNSMFWRFYPISENDVDIMISRDCDSRLSIREKLCIEEFEKSDKLFHAMLDHPWHNGIMGGMWGAKKGILENIKELIESWPKSGAWQTDQSFLNSVVSPIVSEVILVHDSINKRNFPSKRVNYEFVGEVYDANDGRYEHYCLFTWPEYEHLN